MAFKIGLDWGDRYFKKFGEKRYISLKVKTDCIVQNVVISQTQHESELAAPYWLVNNDKIMCRCWLLNYVQ